MCIITGRQCSSVGHGGLFTTAPSHTRGNTCQRIDIRNRTGFDFPPCARSRSAERRGWAADLRGGGTHGVQLERPPAVTRSRSSCRYGRGRRRTANVTGGRDGTDRTAE